MPARIPHGISPDVVCRLPGDGHRLPGIGQTVSEQMGEIL